MVLKHEGGEMRTYIRHPSDIPIEIHSENKDETKEESLNNVSVGGLAFQSEVPFDENSVVSVRIPLVQPIFEAKGKVSWCRKEDDHYDVGIEFIETKDGFRVRMVEQICHIEHYKREVKEKEGRSLSGREAALEWISKYAGSFQNEILREIEK